MTDAGPVELARRSDHIRRLGLEAGLAAVGITDAAPLRRTRSDLERRRAQGLAAGMQFTYRNPARSTEPGRLLRDATSIVVGARAHATDAPSRPTDRPAARVARYSWRDEYGSLRASLDVIADELRRLGGRAVVVADDNGLVDREVARRAGLGTYGKNANLLIGRRGSWFVLGSVVTDVELASDEPARDDPCGPCRRCLTACPTGAIVAPGVVDAGRCLAWAAQAPGVFPLGLRAGLGDRLYGCDDCQEVCPENRDQRVAASADDEPVVDVLDLLRASDDELLDRHGRWYIADRDPVHLRRNALLILGNLADGGDDRVADALRAALTSGRPLLVAHAVWAARRLGRDDLLSGIDVTDPLVADELRHPVSARA